mgnify:FL=1|jgi:hypothetical protein
MTDIAEKFSLSLLATGEKRGVDEFNPKPMAEWTDDDIRAFFDQNPNLSLLTYAGMLGLSVGELKEILLEEM